MVAEGPAWAVAVVNPTPVPHLATQLVTRLLEDDAQDKDSRLWSKAIVAAQLDPESLAGKVVRVDLDNCVYSPGKDESDYSATATITSAGGLANLTVELDFSDCSLGVGPITNHVMTAAGIGVDDYAWDFEDAIKDAIEADDHRAIVVHCLTGKIESQIEGGSV